MAFVRAVVQGRVQGVGFRWFARDAARGLALKGVVRNLDNGDVEVQATGDRRALQDLIGQLDCGPGYVTKIECEWSEVEPDFEGFQIAF